ncbi:hypothetical protein HLH17_02200 [Acinetobacter sp. ANC 5380]|uniref:Uncharacterized protein n=1 Tax=Acinetobacter terrae TaxID=2731247 RepID=A0A7Y2RCY7_9GAMM|nr:hypothetical protein [Acinetobacter terrae]NNH76513.1 hypothetical protein [Acinetobacter terrae]
MKNNETIINRELFCLENRLHSYENYLYSVKPIEMDKAIKIERAHKKHKRLMNLLTVLFFITVATAIYLSTPSMVVFICLSQVVLMVYLQCRHLQKYTHQLIIHGIDISECCTQEVSESTYHQLKLVKHPELKQKINEILTLRNNRFLSVDADTLKLDKYFNLNNPNY